MATPQLENGHVCIANEIQEALCRTRIPGEARQILDCIIRKTYGWNKKEDQISISQYVKMTGMGKSRICQAINKLLSMNIITKKGSAQSLFTKKGNDTVTSYGIQKDFDKWVTLPKKETPKIHVTKNRNVKAQPIEIITCDTLPKTETSNQHYQKQKRDVTEKGNDTLPKTGHTKDTITKNTITKDKTPTPLPDFLDAAIWSSFLDHRKKIKKPVTNHGLVFKKLNAWMKEGFDPNQILEDSIINGWQGIFKPKNRDHPMKGKLSTAGQRTWDNLQHVELD